ncbi:MAG: phytanoyl-CoA dioxygenase family protein, partial [Gemmatimonadetes bacterium]|nr:phytanoyl-CoA dioxygenase family protein [Gemmatimonadota bacterium]
ADSHRHGFSDYVEVDHNTHVFGREIVAEQVDMSRVVDLEVREGQCHIHHSKMIHGSNPNTSAKRRCGYTMRYMPATVKVRSTGPHATHAVYLARGRDRAGNEYGEPWVPFAPGIR